MLLNSAKQPINCLTFWQILSFLIYKKIPDTLNGAYPEFIFLPVTVRRSLNPNLPVTLKKAIEP